MTKPLKVPLNVPKEVSDMLSSRMTAEEEESVQVELAALQAEQVRFALFHKSEDSNLCNAIGRMVSVCPTHLKPSLSICLHHQQQNRSMDCHSPQVRFSSLRVFDRSHSSNWICYSRSCSAIFSKSDARACSSCHLS